MSKEVLCDVKQKMPAFVRNVHLVTAKLHGSIRQDWSHLLLRVALFAVNGITLNIASFLVLLGIIMIWCPCINLFPSLIIFDVKNLQFLGLNRLLNLEMVDFHRDINFLTTNFIDEIRIVGYVLFIFALILYVVAFLGCYSAATKAYRCTEFYALLSSALLTSLILISMLYFNRSRVENSSLMDRVECFLKTKYVPSMERESVMDANFIDFFQSRFSCCGIHNGSRYLQSGYPFPLSCCKLMRGRSASKSLDYIKTAPHCPQHLTVLNSNIQIGCFDIILEYINDLVGRTIFLFWILTFIGLTNWLIIRWPSNERSEKENIDP